MSMFLKAFTWVFLGPLWHAFAAYAVGYLVFVTLAILIWGFLYRPVASASDTVGPPWTAEEIVLFAFLQGLAWPLFGFCYAAWCVIIGIFASLYTGYARVAALLAKAIPNDRPPGLQVKR